MKTQSNPKLSFFEAIYVWIYIYTMKSTFLKGRGAPEGAACVNLGFLQFWNLEFIWRSSLLIFNWDISYSYWVDLCFFPCLTAINYFIYEKKIDNIIERHNALSQQKRLRNRFRMWIYVILTGLSTIGLLTAIELTREKPEAESTQDRIRIEIKKSHVPNQSTNGKDINYQ